MGSRLILMSQQLSVEDSIDEIDVLCVNCYECIPASKVDIHSKNCIIPQAAEDSETDEIDSRIIKLQNSMTERINNSYGDKVLILMQLQEIAHVVIDCGLDSYAILDRLDNIANSCNLISESASCAIFARRLANLVELKGQFGPKNDNMTDEEMLKFYEDEAERQQKELDR